MERPHALYIMDRYGWEVAVLYGQRYDVAESIRKIGDQYV